MPGLTGLPIYRPAVLKRNPCNSLLPGLQAIRSGSYDRDVVGLPRKTPVALETFRKGMQPLPKEELYETNSLKGLLHQNTIKRS